MPTVVGLDLGSSAYRAAQITSNKNKLSLDKVISYNVPVVSVVDEGKKSNNNLKEFIKSGGFGSKDVVVALPESNVFSTVLALPLKTEKDIRSYLDLQGNKIFPKPVSELVYSVKILGANEQSKDEIDVNVVASGKEYVEKLYEQLKSIGLNVLSIEPEAYAIVRALMREKVEKSSEVVLILNLGPTDVDMMVIKDGLVRFSRNLTLGGFTFNKAIAQGLGVTEIQAEEYKKSYGLDDEPLSGKVKQALEPVVETLISEITRTMNFYSTRNTAGVFKKIVFSGGSSIMPGLLAYCAGKLGIESELANPFFGIDFSSRLKSQKETIINSGPEYTIAMGLALKEFV